MCSEDFENNDKDSLNEHEQLILHREDLKPQFVQRTCQYLEHFMHCVIGALRVDWALVYFNIAART